MAAKPRKLRPSVLPLTVERARKYVAQHMSQTIADSLGDGDVIDVALELLLKEQDDTK